MRRVQIDFLLKDLERKLVFLSGPRQVGKTWLGRYLSSRFKNPIYLNYDNIQDRQIIIKQQWPLATDILVLDEIHKMDGWKNFVKGIYDTKPESMRMIVTGSARLEMLRQAGDSMAGRFFMHRLMPFSLRELQGTSFEGDIERLISRGGFPEPFLAEESLEADRWRSQYLDGLIQNDVLDVENIRNFRAVKTLIELLRLRVGSPVSYTSLAGDLNISPTTVIKYINLLEALYIVFRVTPYANNIARSLLKEPKIYFYDLALIPESDKGARLENLSAVSMLKHVFALYDYRGESWRLHYLRTKDGHEVDFCLVHDNRIISAVEIKSGDEEVSRGLRYFCSRYQLNGVQTVLNLRQEYQKEGVIVRPLKKFLSELMI